MKKLSAKQILGVLVLLAMVAFYISIAISASYRMPTPWPDESHFLWQAIGLTENGSLFAPQLDSNRHILWMPAGYQIVVAAWYKIVGIGLGQARTLSLIFMIFSFLLICKLTSYYGLNPWALVLPLIFLVSDGFVAAGNVARMEALVCLIVLSGFMLMQRGRMWAGLGMLLLSPLIHTNAIVFMLGGGVFAWLNRDLRLPFYRQRKSALGAVLAVVTAWLAYSIYVANHWHSFVNDMGFQYARKAGRTIMPTLLTFENYTLVALISVAIVIAVRHPRRLRVTYLMTLAIPAWLISIVGQEMWYDIYRSLAYLSFSFIAFHIVIFVVQTYGRNVGEQPLRAIKTWALFCILGILFFGGHINSPIDYRLRFQWQGMYLNGKTPYITDDDKAVVREAIAEQCDGILAPTIRFFPRADALLFYNDLREEYRFSDPVFEKQDADLEVIHISNHSPSWWRFRVSDELHSLQIDSLQQLTPFLTRDETELWYVVGNGI